MKTLFFILLLCLVLLYQADGKPKSRSRSKATIRNNKSSSRKSSSVSKAKTRMKFLETRNKKSKDRFKSRKRSYQIDRFIRTYAILRISTIGMRFQMQRRGQVLAMRVKKIEERKSNNETIEVEDSLDDISCSMTKDQESDTTYSIEATLMETKCQLKNKADVTLQMYMFKEAGNLTGADGNTYQVVEGATKVNVLVNNWPNSTESSTKVNSTEFVDIVVAIKCGFEDEAKGRKPLRSKLQRGRLENNSIRRRSPETFDVCPNARSTFAPNYLSDGNQVEMPEGFPKAEIDLNEDKEAEFTLRFKKGGNIIYDPIVEAGDDIGDYIPSAGKSIHMFSCLLMVICSALVLPFMY